MPLLVRFLLYFELIGIDLCMFVLRVFLFCFNDIISSYVGCHDDDIIWSAASPKAFRSSITLIN